MMTGIGEGGCIKPTLASYSGSMLRTADCNFRQRRQLLGALGGGDHGAV